MWQLEFVVLSTRERRAMQRVTSRNLTTWALRLLLIDKLYMCRANLQETRQGETAGSYRMNSPHAYTEKKVIYVLINQRRKTLLLNTGSIQ